MAAIALVSTGNGLSEPEKKQADATQRSLAMQPSMDTCEGHTPPRRATRRSSLVGEVRGRLGLCPSPQPASSDQTEFLHLKVALEADDGDSVEHFALHFSSSEAAGDAQKAMASAQAAEAELVAARKRHRPQLVHRQSSRTMKRAEVVRILVFALKEDRMRTDRYNASSLRRALHELAGSHMVGNPELGLRFTTPLQSVSKELELHRLMGRWHVLAIIPSSTLEKGSHNYIEDLCWDGDLGHIQVCGSFADASGKRRTIKRTAWVRDLKTCAEWRVTASVSGINLDPWSLQILHCTDDYTAFMAGDSMRMSLKMGEHVAG